MKTGIGQSKYRNLTLFHVVWLVPTKVFLTLTFSISSILTDHDLYGSDVEQGCSCTVFAVFFFFSTLNQTFFEGVKRIGSRDTWRQNDIQKKILNGVEMINYCYAWTLHKCLVYLTKIFRGQNTVKFYFIKKRYQHMERVTWHVLLNY